MSIDMLRDQGKLGGHPLGPESGFKIGEGFMDAVGDWATSLPPAGA